MTKHFSKKFKNNALSKNWIYLILGILVALPATVNILKDQSRALLDSF
jgi:hypothetical protein